MLRSIRKCLSSMFYIITIVQLQALDWVDDYICEDSAVLPSLYAGTYFGLTFFCRSFSMSISANQGWVRISLKSFFWPRRFFGFLWISFLIRSYASAEVLMSFSTLWLRIYTCSGNLTSSFTILSNRIRGFLSKNGRRPNIISKRRMPMAHQSTVLSYFLFSTISGARYGLVPTKVRIWSSQSSRNLTIPKSAKLT